MEKLLNNLPEFMNFFSQGLANDKSEKKTQLF